MSAFLVSDNTMNRAVSAILQTADHFGERQISRFGTTCGDIERELGQAIGAELYAMNHEALRQRYLDHQVPAEGEPWTFKPMLYPFAANDDRRVAITALQCLHYQCAEGNVPETNPLFAELHRIAADIALQLLSANEGYVSIAWE